MTLRELVERELGRAEEDIQDLTGALESAKHSAARTALIDDDAFMPGGGLAHAALDIAKLRTKLDAALDRACLLKYLLREDSAAQGALKSS